MKKSCLAFIFPIIVMLPGYVHSQGCSDAGFCSIGDLKSNTSADSIINMNSISAGIAYGIGLENTQTLTPYFEFQHHFSQRFNVQSKLTAGYATGELGNNFAMGDWYVSGNYSIFQNKQNKISALVGIKIPLHNSNSKNDEGLPLPLDYQSSLATYDLIAGTHFNLNKFGISAGLQLPVSQNNKNSFYPWLYENMKANQFSPTNKFERKGDVLLRATYRISMSKSTIKLIPGILALYHLGNDTYKNISNQNIEINNSKGLTINAAIQISKTLNNYNEIELAVASPLVVREVRPDGLTRSFVVSIQYKIPF